MKILVLLFIMLSLLGCSKQAKIKHALWDHGGEWDISQWNERNMKYNPTKETKLNLENCGSFIFKKDGSGILSFNNYGNYYTQIFSYTNTEDKIRFVWGEGGLFPQGETRIFNLDWKKKPLFSSSKRTFTIFYYEDNPEVGNRDIRISLIKK